MFPRYSSSPSLPPPPLVRLTVLFFPSFLSLAFLYTTVVCVRIYLFPRRFAHQTETLLITGPAGIALPIGVVMNSINCSE